MIARMGAQVRYRRVMNDVLPGTIRGPAVTAKVPVPVYARVVFRDVMPGEEIVRGMDANPRVVLETWQVDGCALSWSFTDGAAHVRVRDPISGAQYELWMRFADLHSLDDHELLAGRAKPSALDEDEAGEWP